MQYRSHYESPLGGITLASDGEALTGLWFDGQKYFGSTLTGEEEEKDLVVFDQTRKWLDLYFEGKKPDFVPNLGLRPHSSGKQYGESFWRFLTGRPLPMEPLQIVWPDRWDVLPCLPRQWAAQWDTIRSLSLYLVTGCWEAKEDLPGMPGG